MPTIELNDTTIHYERSGHGPALLFVHGMCGDADVWADQARRLGGRFTCVRYDRRGHSRSARGHAPITVTAHADDAAALIAALQLSPCLLVGSSAGAVIGVDVVLRHGHLLRGVVLSEPPLFSLDPAGGENLIEDIRAAVGAALAANDLRAAVDAFFTLICPGLWSAIDDEHRDRYRANGGIGFTELRSPPLVVTPEDLAAAAVPALVVSGTDSHPVLQSVAQRLAALPDARFVELAGSGHVTYAEQPAVFADAVAVFDAELAGRAAISGRP